MQRVLTVDAIESVMMCVMLVKRMQHIYMVSTLIAHRFYLFFSNAMIQTANMYRKRAPANTPCVYICSKYICNIPRLQSWFFLRPCRVSVELLPRRLLMTIKCLLTRNHLGCEQPQTDTSPITQKILPIAKSSIPEW